MGLVVGVVGLGTVGETLCELLLAHRSLLGVERVVVLRRAVPEWDEPRVRSLEARAVLVATEAIDHRPAWRDVCDDLNYIFDCGPNGHALANRERYDTWQRVAGVCAQGSETGFGRPFMSGVAAKIDGARHVQVVSCNTHGSAALLTLFAGPSLERLIDSDFVVVRRSEDLGRHERLVGATVVARHRDAVHGTHHAADVARLFTPAAVPITSSDATTPSQLMHAVRFRIRARGLGDMDIDRSIDARPWLARSSRFDSNAVFECGRRHGFQGRVWAHAVVLSHDLLRSGDLVSGWAFVPQECNTLPSSIEAMLRQTGYHNVDGIMQTLAASLTREQW